MRLLGDYILDLHHTALLRIGPDRDRFVTPAGFELALEQFAKDNADISAATSLTVTPTTLTLRTAEGEETFPINKLSEKKGKMTLVLDWYGEEEKFEVRELEKGVLHLANEENELSEYAWRAKGK